MKNYGLIAMTVAVTSNAMCLVTGNSLFAIIALVAAGSVVIRIVVERKK